MVFGTEERKCKKPERQYSAAGERKQEEIHGLLNSMRGKLLPQQESVSTDNNQKISVALIVYE